MSKAERKSTVSEIPEDRLGEVADFGEMKSYLPDDLPESKLNLLKGYFDVQLQWKKKKYKHGDRKLEELEGKGLKEFENEREDLFILIDLAVRKSTNREEVRNLGLF